MIRKFVFGGKQNKSIDLESFKDKMDQYGNVLISPSLIRQEYLYFMGREKRELFDGVALEGLGSVTKWGSSQQSGSVSGSLNNNSPYANVKQNLFER